MMKIRATIIANVAFVTAALAFSAAGNPFDTATEQTSKQQPYMIAGATCYDGNC